jgi:ZIP family zinc transporter
MLEAGLWGAAAAAALVIGAGLGLVGSVPRRVVALVMGFGAGALISALAFDLTAEAFADGGTLVTAAGLAVGALVFFLGDQALERREQRRRRRAGGSRPRTSGPAIVLGVLLDGIPESFVLGASLVGGAGVTVSFLGAVFASNLPEGVAGARDLRDEGHDPRWILGLWLAVVAVSGLAAAIGYAALGAMPGGAGAFVEAFAAGAILAMLADTMIPEAFDGGGPLVGLATVIGFAAAFFLSAVPG